MAALKLRNADNTAEIYRFGAFIESAEMQSEETMMLKKNLSFLFVLSLSVFFISCEPPEDYELSEPGEYTECYYDTDLESSAYSSAFIVYPCETSEGPFPALTFTGGITNVKEQVAWLADHVVTYGFILIVMTPTNNMSVTTDVWENAMLGGLEMLESENNRSSSPIYNLVDTQRLGIMGFQWAAVAL